MNLAQELEEAKKKQVEVVNEINALDQRKQSLIQEALRCDGAIMILQKLKKEEESHGEKGQKD